MSTVAACVFGGLAVATAGVSLATVTAWFDPSSTDAKSYFGNVYEHSGVAIAAFAQFAGQAMISALVERAAIWVSGRNEHTVNHKNA